MTTSGTFTSTFPIDDLLTECWERIGLSPQIINAQVADSFRRSLQFVLISWTNTRAPLWQIIPVPLTLTQGVSTVTLGVQYADVLDMYVTSNSTDFILGRVPRSDYVAYPNKAQQGRPTQVWVDRQLGAPVLNFFPTPDATYVVTAYCLRQPQDVSTLMQTADAPFLWADALASAVTLRMAEKYAPARVEEKAAFAADAYTKASGESRERVPLRIMPEFY